MLKYQLGKAGPRLLLVLVTALNLYSEPVAPRCNKDAGSLYGIYVSVDINK